MLYIFYDYCRKNVDLVVQLCFYYPISYRVLDIQTLIFVRRTQYALQSVPKAYYTLYMYTLFLNFNLGIQIR